MRLTLAYNQKRDDTESQAELLSAADVDQLHRALKKLGHEVTPVEVSGPADQAIDRLVNSRPELVFNVAEGTSGATREAIYPAIYKQLGLAFTGGGTGLLLIDLDKRLAEKVLSVRGINVPQGTFLSADDRKIPDHLTYPLIIKPNYEGSGKGIHQNSIVETPEEARKAVDRLLRDYPDGLDIEEFIAGRELTVSMLEAWPGHLLEIVEHTFEDDSRYNIYDFEHKQLDMQNADVVKTICPPELSPEERQSVLDMASRVFKVMPCPDLGRVDIRLRKDGTPFFIELNPLPRLLPDGSLIIAAKAKGLSYTDVLKLIIRSAARRYALPLAEEIVIPPDITASRPTGRELGISIGRLPTGTWNAITDVEGIHVGHTTHVRDGVPVHEGEEETTCVRTGITAIVPRTGELFHNHLVAGGFVLNGIGEMSGLTQAIEWGWLETPILLTNTLSLGLVHNGIIRHMIEKHPELGRQVDVIIPLVAETNDAFLNDVRLLVNTPELAMETIRKAKSGPVEQGSVGGGTGMISFDFAGGIGSSSRVLPKETGGYTVGVLVQSNFGKMRNLTIDGAVIGRELDRLYPREIRRGKSYGSVITIVATDAPLLSPQINQLAKRAALGLGRVGSYAATTSGEIVFAFSTGNRTSREAKEQSGTLELSFVTDDSVNLLYEAAVEATEEAVLNAMFCSSGMTGFRNRFAPQLPADTVQGILARWRRG